MQISDSSVSELRALLSQHYGRKFTQEQARRYGRWLIHFYSHLAEKSGTGRAQKVDPKPTSTATNNSN